MGLEVEAQYRLAIETGQRQLAKLHVALTQQQVLVGQEIIGHDAAGGQDEPGQDEQHDYADGPFAQGDLFGVAQLGVEKAEILTLLHG